jgi:hypothetical protein
MLGFGKTEMEKTPLRHVDDLPAVVAPTQKLAKLVQRQLAIEQELADAKAAAPESEASVNEIVEDFLAEREPRVSMATATQTRPIAVIVGERNAILLAIARQENEVAKQTRQAIQQELDKPEHLQDIKTAATKLADHIWGMHEASLAADAVYQKLVEGGYRYCGVMAQQDFPHSLDDLASLLTTGDVSLTCQHSLLRALSLDLVSTGLIPHDHPLAKKVAAKR